MRNGKRSAWILIFSFFSSFHSTTDTSLKGKKRDFFGMNALLGKWVFLCPFCLLPYGSIFQFLLYLYPVMLLFPWLPIALIKIRHIQKDLSGFNLISVIRHVDKKDTKFARQLSSKKLTDLREKRATRANNVNSYHRNLLWKLLANVKSSQTRKWDCTGDKKAKRTFLISCHVTA